MTLAEMCPYRGAMRWFRAFSRTLAVATLLAQVTLGALTSLGHDVECHDDCLLAVVPHDAASHTIGSGASGATATPLHCVLCHCSRLTRPSPEPSHFLAHPAVDDVLLPVVVLGMPSTVQAAQPPLRSPPLA